MRDWLIDITAGMHPDLADIIGGLHFLRAEWFYAFIPLVLYLLWKAGQRLQVSNWNEVVDPQLAPFILSRTSTGKKRYPLLLVFIAASLCITALAGPVYKKLPQPVFREISSLVILLDLSQSMDAEDIKPSRLQRAKLELLDILDSRNTGQTALIVYAADAFVVTPLTDDVTTIANLVPSLQTDMMPAQGSDLAAALSKAFSLLNQSGVIDGDILVITDDIGRSGGEAIEKLAAQGHRVSVFGIGTAQGAPIPIQQVDPDTSNEPTRQGGFLLDTRGSIVIPRLDAGKLQSMASDGGGVYISLTPDERDTRRISRLVRTSSIDRQPGGDQADDQVDDQADADLWREEGHWLLLPLLLLASLWFRRGWIALLIVFTMPLPQPVYAAATSASDDGLLQNLWQTPDQQAMEAFQQGDNDTAADKFTDPRWQASALYRKGDYQAATEKLNSLDSADAHYNRGNALAKLGKYEQAIKAYDQALSLDKDNEDAAYNREQVNKALQEQQAQQQDGDSQQDDSQNESDRSEQQSESQQGDSGQEQSSDSQSEDDGSEQQGEQKQQDNAERSDQNQDGNKQDQASTDTEESGEQGESENAQTQQQDQQQAEQQNRQQLQQRDAEQEKQQAEQAMQDYQKSQQAMQNREGEEKPEEVEVNPEQVEASITEKQQATRQWLRRIPDDPGGLLRRKFLYQYKNLPDQNDSEQPW